MKRPREPSMILRDHRAPAASNVQASTHPTPTGTASDEAAHYQWWWCWFSGASTKHMGPRSHRYRERYRHRSRSRYRLPQRSFGGIGLHGPMGGRETGEMIDGLHKGGVSDPRLSREELVDDC